MKEELQKKLFTPEGTFRDRSVRALDKPTMDRLLEFGPPGGTVTEAIYWVMNDLKAHPKSCKSCGKAITRFISYNQAYKADYCSAKCSNSAPEVKETKKSVSREKYGTDFPVQSKSVIAKISQKLAATFSSFGAPSSFEVHTTPFRSTMI